MYRYNMMGNINTLFVDSTDSYFHNAGKITANTTIRDKWKFQLAENLVHKIPLSFLKTEKREQNFGCPDCTDGCGIYFEMGDGITMKKFHIDYRTENLDTEVKQFGESVKKTLDQLSKRNQ
jgi:hypothetical protein